jgi:hypothetical protein
MYVTMSIAFRLLIAVSNIIDLSNARPLSPERLSGQCPR